MNIDPLDKKWEAFGWNVQEINGHDFLDMKKAFSNLKKFKKTKCCYSSYSKR